MKYLLRILLFSCIVCIVCIVHGSLPGFMITIEIALAMDSPPPAHPITTLARNTNLGQDNTQNQEGKKTLFNRIDFGNSYILGQSIKSGAVYLLQRKKNEIRSMLSYRKDFRKEILEDFSIQDQHISK